MDTDKIAELRGKLRDLYDDLGYAVECRSETDTAHNFLRKAYEEATEITAELKQLAE